MKDTPQPDTSVAAENLLARESIPSTEKIPAAAAQATHRPSSTGTDIAVVGLSCRFPGGQDLQGYWNLLTEGRSAIRAVPPERWGHASTHVAGLLDDIRHFDPAFFQISEADARAMDPQALLVLEEALMLWHHAGYMLREIKGQPIGVYLGARSAHRPDAAQLAAASNPILAVGANYLASNISHFFDLRGPSMVIDTACSSALTAMSLAIQALHGGDISAALVGGVSLLQSDAALQIFAQRGILNQEPQFHLFDQRAQGAILGEGVGMVLLKRLDQAIEDGDRIYAIVKGLAVNNDGRTAGPTAPNPQAQKDVMQAALAKSGRCAQEIGYIETNGSGSELTDLLELKSIESVYRADSTEPCHLGSMKPNIGHPLCAEGIASFIKVVLMLHHRQWVPFLSAHQPMTHYDFAVSPFRFHRASSAWTDTQRLAAINCFADGGTNAHLIMQGWEPQTDYAPRRSPLDPPRLKRLDVQSGVAANLVRAAVVDTLAVATPVVTTPAVETSVWQLADTDQALSTVGDAGPWGQFTPIQHSTQI